MNSLSGLIALLSVISVAKCYPIPEEVVVEVVPQTELRKTIVQNSDGTYSLAHVVGSDPAKEVYIKREPSNYERSSMAYRKRSILAFGGHDLVQFIPLYDVVEVY